MLASDGDATVSSESSGSPAEVDPRRFPLGGELADSLDEWARVAEAVSRRGQTGDGVAARLVSRRGRQLAGRVAAAMGGPVTYVDPVTGESIEVTVAGPDTSRLPERVSAPVPWSTGLTVSAFTAVVVVAAVLVLSQAMDAVSPWLAVAANLVIGAGLAPSVWATRRLLVWRWVSLGVVTGVVVAWIAALCTLS